MLRRPVGLPWPGGDGQGCPAAPPAGGPECSPLCTAMTGRWCWVKLERRGESWGDGLLKGDLSISVFFTGDEMPVWGGARGSQGCRQGGSTPRTPASLLKALPLFLPAACGPGAGGLFYRWSKLRLTVEKGAARGLRPRCHHRPLTCPPGPSPFLIPETGPPRAARAPEDSRVSRPEGRPWRAERTRTST